MDHIQIHHLLRPRRSLTYDSCALTGARAL
jgi:hypothetical protein